MELQDTSSETLNGTVWLGQSPSSLYQRLSPSERQDERNVIISEQVSMGYHVQDGIILWQENKELSKNDHQLHTNCNIARGNSPTSEPPVSSYHHSTSNGLKRRSNENHQTIGELDRKYIRRDGSVVSNGSVHGWSSGQVEELAEHLVADFDGSLSGLAATDLASAVASYNMSSDVYIKSQDCFSEALLTLPSALTVFKQEAPSPENHVKNSNLNQVSPRTSNGVHPNNGNIVPSVEPDSNHNCNGATTTKITTTTPTSTSINNRNINDNNTNTSGGNNNNGGRGAPETTTNFQFLYSNNDDYPTTSSAGNHVSSSQQGNEFNEDSRFQYVLAAATSIATKINEETLTYLNQGQSYEIKLKKLGDLSAYRGKILKSTIRICFHERRLQYTEKEQILTWQRSRPGERLLEVDIPLSYGMLEIAQSSSSKNNVEFMWDPTKEVGVYIKVNCISTEFTPKKHGGEKGVPFRIQVETLLPGGPRLHAASCQIKVFKLKGADRKHKQDRDKVLRRPSHEQDKYQPSYDCTVLSDIPLDSLSSADLMSQSETIPLTQADANAPQISVNTSDSGSPSSAVNSPVSETSSEDSTTVMPTSSNETFRFVPSHPPPKNRNVQEAAVWLRKYFPAHELTFANYSGIDLLNLTRQELIEFCGPIDGIRMYNEITEKAPVPRLVIYCALEIDAQPIWKMVRLFEKTADALTEKLSSVFDLSKDRLHSILFQGPRGIHVSICNDFVSHMEKDSVYLVQILTDSTTGYFKLLLKPFEG